MVNVCTGDLGQGQVQKFDIETWMPSRKNYGETHSASRFYEYQARRLMLRYQPDHAPLPLLKSTFFGFTVSSQPFQSPRLHLSGDRLPG